MFNIKASMKKLTATTLCIISLSSAVYSCIPTAQAATNILGSNVALGSPILNSGATTDDWNKWEMVCWGVFLSNWCQPLLDTYETAFSTASSEGSAGAGYQALCFGSGSDPANNQTIQDFCTYAIKTQQSSDLRKIYVSYTHVKDNKFENKIDPNTLDVAGSSEDTNENTTTEDTTTTTTTTTTEETEKPLIREATFKDFFFTDEVEEDKTTITYSNSADYCGIQYGAAAIVVDEAYVPTFYVKNSEKKYVEILDFTNSWDLQAFSSMINSIRQDTSTKKYSELFNQELDNCITNNVQIGLDCFGNIVLDNRKILFPACNNQHITEEKSINILNSWIMNNYNTTYSNDQYVKTLRQMKLGLAAGGIGEDKVYNGLPAFGESGVGNIGLLFYDTDSIVLQSEANDSNIGANYGKLLQELYNCDIKNKNTKYNLKFELTDIETKLGDWNSFTDGSPAQVTLLSSSLLSNINTSDYNSNQPNILDHIVDTDGKEIELISNTPVAIAVQANNSDSDKGKVKNGEALRTLYNWMYQVYSGSDRETTNGSIKQSQIKALLDSESSSMNDFRDVVDNNLWQYFISAYPTYKDADVSGALNCVFDYGFNETVSQGCNRVVLAYPVSNTMKAVSSALSLKDGTEFDTYCTLIYMTYLDFYGVINKSTIKTGSEAQSNFSKDIFDETSDILNVDPADVTPIISEEDKEKEVLNLSYLMLSPEGGRSYRKELIYNGISDFLYEQYNRIVYGGASSVYSGSSTKSNSGFLAVPTFSENFATKWFLNNYVDISVVMIMTCVIILLIIGILKGRKISWFIMGIFTIVNVILLVPSSGEITPYITTSFTQKIFSNKMTYWTLSEGIANASLEEDAYTSSGDLSGLDSEDARTVLKLVNELSVTYTDRSLMLKQDISQKLTQELGGIYTNIQEINSARWIIPMVMQQFSADRQDEENFVYVKLANVWDDGSNLYWYYKPDDAISVTKPTLTSQRFRDEGEANTYKTRNTGNGNRNRYGESSDGNYLVDYYTDYVAPTWADDTNTEVNYANYSYTVNNDNNENVHTYSFILHNQNLGLHNDGLKRSNVFGENNSEYKNADSWQNWIDTVNNSLTSGDWATNSDSDYAFETIADTYNRSEPLTLQDGYSYYKTTESPYYYFFNVVKDSFPSDKTIGALIGRLQGTIEENADGEEVRANFMYATRTVDKEQEDSIDVSNSDVEYTGHVRDVLDLQMFFTNTVPYMYEMTLAAGGFDGESGVLGSDTITDGSDYYEGNLQSWAYRCNWAVKLMENTNYSKPTTVRTSTGEKVEITNQLLPDSYPSNRPMVFSEAQMYAEGLSEEDLSLVELKCVAVNKAVARDWTLLINYAGTPGITKEVFFRVMATDATEEFCKEFSSGGILDNNYSLYPQSIDLRYLSFDSIMKMLMINVSKNTSYAYGDTMDTLLNDSDLFTAFLLLACSALCVWLIPLAQQIIMALVFYLGFAAIARTLLSNMEYKGKVAMAQLVNNLLFMGYTLVYYGILGALMAISSSDEVLSVNKIASNPGNPVWMLLIVIIVSIVYIVAMGYHISFCVGNYRDMGLSVMEFVTGTVVENIQDAVGSVRDGFSGLINGDGFKGFRSSTGGTDSIKGTGSSKETAQNVIVTDVSSSIDQNDDAFSDDNNASYSTGEADVTSDDITTYDINAEIETGEQMENKN